MNSRPQHVPTGPVPPDRGESELDGVRRRMEADEMRPDRFNAQPEVLDAEAHLIAAARPKVRRNMTDLAVLLGLGYDLLAKYVNGARVMPMDVLASMQLAGDKVPEAREWCLAFARALVGRWGWTLTPPDTTGDVVTHAAASARSASDLAAGTMEDLAGDGVITPTEADRRLPKALENLENARRLTMALTELAHRPTLDKNPESSAAACSSSRPRPW